MVAPVLAQPQLFQRATVIEDVRVLSRGVLSEPVTVVIRGGRIAQLGADVDAPGRSDVIDGAGGVLTAPLVDVWSSLALSEVSETPGAAARAHETFDPYADVLIRDALRNGVGIVHLGPLGGSGVTGVGAIVKLKPRDVGGYGEMVNDASAICVDLRSSTAIERLKLFNDVRSAFRGANDYRETLEVYDEELETYLEELKKLEDEDGKENEGKADESDENGKAKEEEKPKNGKPGNGKKDDDKKDEGPKKPERPGKSVASETLLRAIDGELPVRVRADHSADILNALELAAEFKIDIVIEGGAQSGRVASRLAEAEVPVILAPPTSKTMDETTGRPAEVDVASLDAADVEWYVGTGFDGPRGSRGVLLAAQRISTAGDDIMGRVTGDAASLIGVGGPFAGRVGRGSPADLVLWSGDPLSPGSRVRHVWLDGETAYAR